MRPPARVMRANCNKVRENSARESRTPIEAVAFGVFMLLALWLAAHALGRAG